jgi:hypothetical protein
VDHTGKFLLAMRLKYLIKPFFMLIVLQIYPASALDIAASAVNLNEELISVDLGGEKNKSGFIQPALLPKTQRG